MRPRGALCRCCENTLLWDVETVLLYGRWMVGRSRLSSYFEGMSSGLSGGFSRLFAVMPIVIADSTGLGFTVMPIVIADSTPYQSGHSEVSWPP
jgi:hypothetical protein